MLLYAAKGCGSALAEIALDWAGVQYDTEWMTFEQVGARSHDALLAANPLHQVPTLVLDDGTVLTESAAIVLWLDEQYPQAGLLPPRGSAERVHALRWMLYLVTTLYPTFSYGDFPGRRDRAARAGVGYEVASPRVLASGRRGRDGAVVLRRAAEHARRLHRADEHLGSEARVVHAERTAAVRHRAAGG